MGSSEEPQLGVAALASAPCAAVSRTHCGVPKSLPVACFKPSCFRKVKKGNDERLGRDSS